MNVFSLRSAACAAALSLAFVGTANVTPALAQETQETAKQADSEVQKNTVDTYRLLNLFGDVFERVRAEYVEPPTDQEMIEAAITGMLASLDPHSSYLNPKGYKDMQVNTQGEFGGLGIQVTMEGGYVKVISPIDDTPAFRAGVKSGDVITHLDGEPVQGLTLNQAVEKMRGRVGSDIELSIRREGEANEITVTITRAVIKITPVRSRVEDKIGYVRITSFNAHTSSGLNTALGKFQDELGDDLQGIVLDLRNNPGGRLDQAVEVADAFLEKGEIVSTRSRRPEDTERYNARAGDLAKDLPVVVLINGGSASASEIVAGALQDHRRAIVMGTASFGKGSVQTIMPLPGAGAMRLTTARYYTPSGRSIQGTGIDPDIRVAPANIEEIDVPRRMRESDLRGSLDNGQPDPQSAPETPAPGADGGANDNAPETATTSETQQPEDYQLSRALDLIRGLALYAGSAPEQGNVKTN